MPPPCIGRGGLRDGWCIAASCVASWANCAFICCCMLNRALVSCSVLVLLSSVSCWMVVLIGAISRCTILAKSWRNVASSSCLISSSAGIGVLAVVISVLSSGGLLLVPSCVRRFLVACCCFGGGLVFLGKLDSSFCL